VSQLWWLLPFIFLIAKPGVYMSMWAVPLLAPAIVGVLYMTEIRAAAISSALWSGEPFGVREILGIALITVAAVLESVPAKGFAEVRGKYEKLMAAGVDAIRKLAELILEEGHGDDSKVRIAFHGLAIYAGQREADRKVFAEAISIELETAAPATVKMFLMQQALIAGAIEANEAIGKLVHDEEVGV
jgi:hypothetical protein